MSLVIGIDLGTTNSCIAVYRNDEVEIIPNQDEKTITPSHVFYSDDGIIVGGEAVKLAATHPANGIFEIKRIIGKTFDDPNVQIYKRRWPFVVNRVKDDECRVEIIWKKKKYLLRTEEISAQILKKLKEDAVRVLKTQIRDAVITVPAYFTNVQKQATENAAKLAGLNVLKLLNEPTAAALAFNKDSRVRQSRTILVYDLGGGTFDVSLVRFNNFDGDVLSVSGDNNLGGKDFDDQLIIHISKKMKEIYNFSIDELEFINRRRAIRRLRLECESLKRKLSEVHTASINLSNFYNHDIEIEVSRKTFEEINAELFEETIEIIDDVLKEANVKEVDEVLLVGGSTKIPKIRQLIKEYFKGKEPNKSVNPLEAVARGAAIQAAILSRNPLQKCDAVTITDVVPFSLGLEVVSNKSMNFLIRRNTRLPTMCEKTYYTIYDYQKEVKIKIFEGESQDVRENSFLGEFVIDGITPKPLGEVEIRVRFSVDLNGILNVSAKEDSKNIIKELNISLWNSRMTDKDINESSERMNSSESGHTGVRRINSNKAEDDENDENCAVVSIGTSKFEEANKAEDNAQRN